MVLYLKIDTLWVILAGTGVATALPQGESKAVMDNRADQHPPDHELVAQTARGDKDAFELLVRRHERSVLNFIYRFLGDRAQAEDLAQEAFLRVWRAAKGYEPFAKFTTWLYRIVANLCLNEIKSPWRKRLVFFGWFGPEDSGSEPEWNAGVPDGAPSPEDHLLAQERHRRLAGALRSLPENQRLAIVLKLEEDLSYQEIAQVLGCSVSAVESLLVRGKRSLQRKLADQ